MIRKFMTTVALGSLFVGGLALAQPDAPQGRIGRGGPIAMADADKDGNLTRAELTQALTARFAKMDTNGDGTVTKEEREAKRAARLDERFASIDTDKNGQISKAEFAAGHNRRTDGRMDGDRRGPGRPDGGPHMRGGHMRHMDGGKMGGRPDANRDAPLTREAFMAQPLAMFDKVDANKDGTLTAAERQASRAAMRDGWQARQAEAKK